MQSKNAINNLINRYKTVLKKCHLLNTFGSLLKHSAMTAGFVAVLASAVLSPSVAQAFQLICDRSGTSVNCYTVADQADYFLLEPAQMGKSYVSNISLPGSGMHGLLYKNPADQSTYSDINALLGAIIPRTVDGRYEIKQGTAPVGSNGIDFNTVVNSVTTPYYVTPLQTPSEPRIGSGLSADITSGAFYNQSDTRGGAILNENINGGYNITADFFANTAAVNGGAFHNRAFGNNEKASIGDINATFIANTADGAGGAFYNQALGTNATANIGNINASFIANTATNYEGGAFYNQANGTNANASIGDINASFIANTAGNTGGAFFNSAFATRSTASIGDINATFIANTAGDNGGAFYNRADDDNATASIGDINATFIANTATNYQGGAFYNNASGTNAKASIGNINATFIANTAGEHGGAFYNRAISSDATASIGNINADFIANIADSDNNGIGLGGAIWTNRSLNFLADSKTNIFSGNMDSTGYNAIYIHDSGHGVDLALNFAMQNVGSYILNDSITTNVAGAYDVNIAGQDANKNIFFLNNVIDGADNVNVQAATLSLGTVNHAGQNFVGGINANNTNINNGGVLEVAVGEGNTAYISGNLNFNSGGTFKHISGMLNSTSANFASNSLFIHDADSMDSNVGLVSNGGTLRVADGAKLNVLSTKPTWQVKPITIVSGFSSSSSNVQGWDNDDARLISPSSLQRLHVNDFDYSSGTLTAKVVNNTPAGIKFDYPRMQYKTASFLSNVSADVYSSNAGVRLFSRAADERFVGRIKPKDATKTIEGALQIGNLAGLNKSGLDVGLVTSTSIQARLSPTGLGTASQEAPAVAMLEGSNVNVEQGVAAGSHMQTSGIQDGFALWLSPLYKHSFVHGHESGSFDHSRGSDIGGLTLGADYTFSEMFRLGLAFNLGTGFTRNNGDFDNTQNDFDFWNLSLYGAFYKNNFALLADVSLSKVFGDVDQDLPSGMMMSNLEASTESTVWTAGLRAEYTFMTSFMDITPYLGARYMHVQTYEYDVKSGGTAMTMEADSQGVWYFPVGVSFSKDIVTKNNWVITPKLDLGVIAATGDMDSTSSARVSGVGGVDYTMQNVDGFAFNGGLGLEIVKDDFSMGFNYNLQASEHETGHILFATFKYTF